MSCLQPPYDIELVKGSTVSLIIRASIGVLGNYYDLSGGVAIFRSEWTNPDGTAGSLRKELTIVNPTGGEIPVTFTVAETRAFPTGPVARYAIEFRATGGSQVAIVSGYIRAKYTPNDDV